MPSIICLGWQRIPFTLRAQGILRHPKLSDIVTQQTKQNNINWSVEKKGGHVFHGYTMQYNTMNNLY